MVISAPLVSVILVTLNALIRANVGSVRKTGSDLVFAASSAEAGFVGLDFKLESFDLIVFDFILFLAFFCAWAGVILYLRVDKKCPNCHQSMDPTGMRAVVCGVLGYCLVIVAIVIRLSLQGLL